MSHITHLWYAESKDTLESMLPWLLCVSMATKLHTPLNVHEIPWFEGLKVMLVQRELL